jgi:hypothetical protein
LGYIGAPLRDGRTIENGGTQLMLEFDAAEQIACCHVSVGTANLTHIDALRTNNPPGSRVCASQDDGSQRRYRRRFPSKDASINTDSFRKIVNDERSQPPSGLAQALTAGNADPAIRCHRPCDAV